MSPGLQMFMECFQGFYRDRTDGGWECRYFAAVYPALRIIIYILYSITLGNEFYMALILLCLGVVVTLLLVKPYKKLYALYNMFDAVMIIILIVYLVCGSATLFVNDEQQITKKAGFIIAGVVVNTPLLYFTVKVLKPLKHVLLNNLHIRSHISHDLWNIQQRDYKDLSGCEAPLNSSN